MLWCRQKCQAIKFASTRLSALILEKMASESTRNEDNHEMSDDEVSFCILSMFISLGVT